MARIVSVLLTANISQFLASMTAAERAALGLTGSLNGQAAAGSKSFGLLSKSVAAFGLATAVGVGSAVKAFTDFDATMSGVQAATRATGSELDSLRQLAIDLGSSTAFSAVEAAQGITELAKAGVSTADIIGGGLSGALDLAAAGQIEVADAAELAASAMVQFGLAGEDIPHVADLLAAGAGKAQGGVAELGQALNQSALVASQMGLTIEETTGALAEFASAGLIGSDAGTSFRSMLLRLANPTDEAKRLMDELGLAFYDAQGNFVGVEAVAGQLQDRLSGLTQEQRNATLATIFGQDAIRAASILYTDGADGVKQWAAAVDDAGFAAQQAAQYQDNLRGDLEKLGGAFNALLISAGAGLDPVLRSLVQSVTDLVDGFNGLSAPDTAAFFAAVGETAGNVWQILVNLWDALGPVVTGFAELGASAVAGGLQGIADALSSITGFLADNERLVTALALAVGAKLVASFALATAKAIQMGVIVAALNGNSLANLILGTGTLSAAFGAAKTAAIGLATAMAPIAAFVGIGFAISEIISMTDEAGRAEDAIKGMLEPFENAAPGDELSGLVTSIQSVKAAAEDAAAAIAASNSQGFSFGSGDDLIENVRIYQEAVSALGDLEREAAAAKVTVSGLADTFGMSTGEVIQFAQANGIDLTDGLDKASEAFLKVKKASQGTTEGQELAAAAAERLGAGFGDAAENAADLITVLDDLSGRFVSVAEATSNYEQSVDDLAQAIADQAAEALGPQQDALNKMATNFDLNTQAGRDLQDQFFRLRDEGNQLISTLIESGDTAGALAADTRLRDNFISSANEAGIFGQAAENLADKILGIPADRQTRIQESGSAEVAAAADKVTVAINAIPDKQTSEIGEVGAGRVIEQAVKVKGSLDNIPVQTIPFIGEVGAAATASAADKVTGALRAIPLQTKPNVSISGTDYAASEAYKVSAAINSIQSRTVTVTTNYLSTGVSGGIASGGYVTQGTVIPGYDIGGPVRGAGTGTSDSILARVSNGEFVNRAAIVAAQGVGAFMALNAGNADIVPRFAEGGPVRTFTQIGSSRPAPAVAPQTTVNLEIVGKFEGGPLYRLVDQRITESDRVKGIARRANQRVSK